MTAIVGGPALRFTGDAWAALYRACVAPGTAMNGQTVEQLRASGLLDDAAQPVSRVAAAVRLWQAVTITVPGVRVAARAWQRPPSSPDESLPASDVAVLEIAVSAEVGVSVLSVSRAGSDRVVELSLWRPEDVLAALWRALPPPVREATTPPDGRLPAQGLQVPLVQALMLARAATEGGLMDVEALAQFLFDVPPPDVDPSFWEALGGDLGAGADVIISARSAAGASQRWVGSWLLAGERLLAAAATRGSDSEAPRVWLADADGASVRRDLLSVLTGATRSAGLTLRPERGWAA